MSVVLSDAELLSDQQMAVIEHPEGPVLVQSGAGSGKTLTLTRRIHHLLTNQGVHPFRIMAVTFTKKAASEMKERLTVMPGVMTADIQSMAIGTVHSIFLRILRSAGFRQKILASEQQKEWILKQLLTDAGLKDDYDPEFLLSELSLLKNKGVDIFEDLAGTTPGEKELLMLFRLYEAHKQEQELLDFDDILVMTKQVLESDALLLSGLQDQFRHILVDEFQDLNGLQFQVIKMIADQGTLAGYGDPSQSIYSFRGSDPRIMLDFREHFPGTNILQLSTNYRSTAPIQQLADLVLLHNNHRHIKMDTIKQGMEPVLLLPENPEDEAKNITRMIKAAPSNSSIAVLARTSEYLRLVLEQLILEHIPCVISSSKCMLYQKPVVKLLLDHLRLAVDPYNDEAMAGVLPTLYLSRKKVLPELNRIRPAAATYSLEKLLLIPELKEYQRDNIHKRIKLLDLIKEATPSEALSIQRDDYLERYINKSYRYPINASKEQVLSKLDELEAAAARFENLQAFVSFVDIVVAKYVEDQEQEEGQVALMTVHSAKGLEFDTVFLSGCIDGLMPHSNSIDSNGASSNVFCVPFADDLLAEECRLLYVAITRAKEELYISAPRNYKDKPADVSRFLNGINLKRGDVVTD